ncbi:hypothetical protein KIW84_052958 [Lathyrus oleraceus]|uniref:BTB domain-containing protein n=1 Tax=Pisum sativum TaxID=3888 RepID=A0A9D4WRJ5_PEA|nr:hypothetical protein KIW84_052958 [Pisum sativum]
MIKRCRANSTLSVQTITRNLSRHLSKDKGAFQAVQSDDSRSRKGQPIILDEDDGDDSNDPHTTREKYLLTTTDWSCLLGSLAHHALSSNLMVPLALCKLANKAMALSLIDAAPPSPTPQVYLGEQYVNNATLSDVTFLVEGKRFYAHRICLLAPSDAFRAMFDGGHRKRI